VAFVERSNKDRNDREIEEKKLVRDKKEREERELALDNEISQLNSDIEKNKDQLYSLKELRQFILELSDQEFL
jgi:hypothetical protein